MNVLHNVPLSETLFYKIGGIAKTVLQIENREDLQEAILFLQKNPDKKVLPIGLGANLLVSDELFDGIVLWFTKPKLSTITILEETKVQAFSSEVLDDLIQFTFTQNFLGFAWAGGLPSTVGGAVRGNVGCFGSEIKVVVALVEVIDLDNLKKGFVQLINTDCQFSYRNSFLKQHKNFLISSVIFQLTKGDQEQIADAQKIYAANIAYREKNHPLEYPSCGSVFKNIIQKDQVEKIVSVWRDFKELSEQKWHNKIAMGHVINRLGFSGYQVGGARVSEKHSNYISNVHHARSSDVIAIIEKIKHKFYDTFGFYPELEVEVVQ